MILDEHKNEKNTNFAFYLYFLGQNRLNKGAFNNYVDQIWTNVDARDTQGETEGDRERQSATEGDT